MSEAILKAALRELKGKKTARRLRREGKVPAVFYGANYEPMVLTVVAKDLKQLIARKPSLVKLLVEGRDDHEVIFREIQLDPVTDEINHVDLLGITRGTKLTVTVRVEMTGIPEGVKNEGGVLEVHRRSLDIECLPKHIPSRLEIDVSHLGLSDSVMIKHLDFPELTFLHDEEIPIATVVPPTITKVEVEEAVEVEEEEAGEAEETEEKSE